MTEQPDKTPAEGTRLIATSFFALFAVVGLTLYGLPLYYPEFVKEMHWTREAVTRGNFFGKVFVGPAFGFLAGWLIDRMGPRRPMMIGLLFAGVAVFGLGTVNGYGFFLLFYVFNAIGYVFGGPLPNQVLLSQNFQRSRGRAMGIAYLGIGIGFAIVPTRTGMPLVLALRRSDTAPRAPTTRAPLRSVLGNRNFYLLALGSFASVGAVGGMNQTLMLLFTLDQHRAAAEARNIITVVAIVSLLGRLGAGFLADRIGPKRVMLLVYLLVASAAMILVANPTQQGIYLFAVVFGLGLGGEYMIIPLMAAELFGTAVLGRVMGIILTFDGAAEAIFPWIVNGIHDRTETYRVGFQLLTALAALGAVAIALLPARPRTRAGAMTQGTQPTHTSSAAS
jgi:MFS family permease